MTFNQVAFDRWTAGRFAIEAGVDAFALLEKVGTATIMVGAYKTLNDAKTAAWLAR